MLKNILRTQHPTSNTNIPFTPPKFDFQKMWSIAPFKISMLINLILKGVFPKYGPSADFVLAVLEVAFLPGYCD